MTARIPEPQDSLRNESRRLIDLWYEDLVSHPGDERKVVYTLSSGSVAELFRAFDFRVVMPEMNAIHCGVKKVAGEMIHEGEALGYSPHICGYMKCDLGLMAGPPRGEGPFGRLPMPDLLVANNGGCFAGMQWFSSLSRAFGKPVRFLDVPFVRESKPAEFDRKYVRGQLEELIEVCEELAGRKLDYDRLKSILALSAKAIALWNRLLSYAKLKPSPIDGFFEAISYMAPLTIIRGTQQCVDYYELALSEVAARLAAGGSQGHGERFRIVFEGAPPWPRLRTFREMFRKWGAVGVAGTYASFVCAVDESTLQMDDPLEVLVDLAAAGIVNWNLARRREYIKKLAEEYKADGIVIHSVRSCWPFSLGQVDMRKYFAVDLGIPTLFLDSDVIDPRFFTSAQIAHRIDAFFEALTASAARRL